MRRKDNIVRELQKQRNRGYDSTMELKKVPIFIQTQRSAIQNTNNTLYSNIH